MAKYHLSPKGPRRCRAEIKACPVQTVTGESVEHFDSLEEAQEAFENIMMKEFNQHATITVGQKFRETSYSAMDTGERVRDQIVDTAVRAKSASIQAMRKVKAAPGLFAERATNSIRQKVFNIKSRLQDRKNRTILSMQKFSYAISEGYRDSLERAAERMRQREAYYRQAQAPIEQDSPDDGYLDSSYDPYIVSASGKVFKKIPLGPATTNQPTVNRRMNYNRTPATLVQTSMLTPLVNKINNIQSVKQVSKVVPYDAIRTGDYVGGEKIKSITYHHNGEVVLTTHSNQVATLQPGSNVMIHRDKKTLAGRWRESRMGESLHKTLISLDQKLAQNRLTGKQAFAHAF